MDATLAKKIERVREDEALGIVPSAAEGGIDVGHHYPWRAKDSLQKTHPIYPRQKSAKGFASRS